MSNPIADVQALIRMSKGSERLAKRLATLALENPGSTPEMRQIAAIIADPKPEHQPVLLAAAEREAA